MGKETNDYGSIGRAGCTGCHRQRQAERHEGKNRWQEATAKKASRDTFRFFFISLGARIGRIRKTPKGTLSSQLYAYKKDRLQELDEQYREGRIDLFFGDGSFTCTEGYVPYGWKFKGRMNRSHPTGRHA